MESIHLQLVKVHVQHVQQDVQEIVKNQPENVLVAKLAMVIQVVNVQLVHQENILKEEQHLV